MDYLTFKDEEEGVFREESKNPQDGMMKLEINKVIMAKSEIMKIAYQMQGP